MLTRFGMPLDVRPRWRFGLVCWLMLPTVSVLAAESLTGKPFGAALDQRIGGAWGGQVGNTLRDVVRQLTDSQHVSIILDRRIDPTQSVELTLPPTPFRDLLSAIASQGNAGLSIVGNVVYVGPPDSAKKLRTLVELRNSDLSKLTSGAPSSKSPWRNRTTALTQRKTFAWQELDRPRDLLLQVASKFQIEIDGLDKLPHDLWAAGSLPQTTATEALSLLLVQFGSTFEFVADRAAIRIVPIPKAAFVERSYTVLANSPVILEAARKRFEDVELEQSGAKLIARGTVERQAELALWLKPGNQKTSKPTEKPLGERRFTLKQRNVSVGEFLKTFSDYGVKIKYDAAELADKGIKLDLKIESIDVKEVSVENLFREVLDPLGVEVAVVDDEIRLQPKGK